MHPLRKNTSVATLLRGSRKGGTKGCSCVVSYITRTDMQPDSTSNLTDDCFRVPEISLMKCGTKKKIGRFSAIRDGYTVVASANLPSDPETLACWIWRRVPSRRQFQNSVSVRLEVTPCLRWRKRQNVSDEVFTNGIHLSSPKVSQTT